MFFVIHLSFCRGPVAISRYMEKLACEFFVDGDASLTSPEDAEFWKQVLKKPLCIYVKCKKKSLKAVAI